MKLALFVIFIFISSCKNSSNTMKNLEVPEQKILTFECRVKRTRTAVSCAQIVDLRHGGITTLELEVPIILSPATCKELLQTNSFGYLGQVVKVCCSNRKQLQIKGKLNPSGECSGEQFVFQKRRYWNHVLIDELEFSIHKEEREYSGNTVLINGRQVEVANEGYQTEQSTFIWSYPITGIH